MNKLLIKQCLASLLLVITLNNLSASRAEEKHPEDLNLNGADCISIRTIRDYTSLSRDSLLIHASGKRTYYVRLLTPQFSLNSSFQLGTRSRDDSLCPFGGDSLVVDRFSGEKSRIQAIKRLTADQVEQVLIRYGKIEPPDTQDPAPPELKGAEVEELG